MKPLLIRILTIALLLSSEVILAQDTLSIETDTFCIERDISDVIRGAFGKSAKMKPEEGEGSLLLLPVIGSNPATGFMIGVGGQYAFQVANSTQYSMIMGSLQLTTKQQFVFMLKNTIYSKDDRIFFNGDWRYLIFSQSTYGIGTNAPEGGILDYQYGLAGLETSEDGLTQPMTFNFLRMHQTVGFKIANKMYLGVGYHFDSYNKIVDEKLRLNDGDSLITSHYAYNKLHGFNTENYLLSALSLNFVIDKRDNIIQAYKGYFLSLNYRGGFEKIGNDRNSNLLQVEWRSFHGLSQRNPAHLIAFWVLGDFVEEGSVPYMVMPATAYDQRGRSARGYTQGRFRGNQFVYGEVEYRFPISPCGGVVGGVLFANATTTNNPAQSLDLFNSIKPSVGFGLRVKADKITRTNFAIDFGFGHQSFGFYLAASETF